MEEQCHKNEETQRTLEGFMLEVKQGKSPRATIAHNENSKTPP